MEDDGIEEIDLYGDYGVFSQNIAKNPASAEMALLKESERFPSVDDDMISQYIADARSVNTDKCTRWALKIFEEWSARRKDGNPYPPRTLYLIACGLLRHLRDNDRFDASFLDKNSPLFGKVRSALDARMKMATKEKVKLHAKHAEYLTRENEQKLWDSGECGDQNSRSLLQTIFYYNCKLFGLRAGDEHRSLSVLDFSIKKTGNGTVIYFKGGKAKNFQGGLKDLMVEPKVIRHFFPNDSLPNIASLYLIYLDAISYDDPFYRRPLESNSECKFRYGSTPIGKNMLSNMVKAMCTRAQIDGHFTNHSVKHTAATQLYQAGIDEQMIMQNTGHRSIGAVRKYKHESADQQNKVSQILGPPQNSQTQKTIQSEKQSMDETLTEEPAVKKNAMSSIYDQNPDDDLPTSTCYLKPQTCSKLSTVSQESEVGHCSRSDTVIVSSQRTTTPAKIQIPDDSRNNSFGAIFNEFVNAQRHGSFFHQCNFEFNFNGK